MTPWSLVCWVSHWRRGRSSHSSSSSQVVSVSALITFLTSALFGIRSRMEPQVLVSLSQTGISFDTSPWMRRLPTCSKTLVIPEPESSIKWPPRLTVNPSSSTANARPPRCGERSRTWTDLPSAARSAPAVRPAAPAPITTTSHLLIHQRPSK